jgi:glutathione peroxidase
MVTRLLLSGIVSLAIASSAWATEPSKALSFKMKSIDGQNVELSKYQGKVILIVNVASKCGLTPQYTELQALYDKYKEKGLVILGFPCNQFRGQEPGSDSEIKQFCSTKYNVTFDLFSKVDVNTESACDLYKYLTNLETKPVGKGDISWNFEKFLLDRQGNVISRFAPRTKPSDKEVVAAVEAALAK